MDGIEDAFNKESAYDLILALGSLIEETLLFDELTHGVPLTSRTASLLPGEFLLADWAKAGLNIPSAVKRGIYTVHPTLVIKTIGTLTQTDSAALQESLRRWLGLS